MDAEEIRRRQVQIARDLRQPARPGAAEGIQGVPGEAPGGDPQAVSGGRLTRFSGLPGRRQEGTDFFENARGDLQRQGRLTFVRFARSVQVAEYDGVVVQVGSRLEKRSKGRIQCGALAAQFVQVVCLAEGNVVKCEKSLGCLLGRLLAVEDRSGWLRRCQ